MNLTTYGANALLDGNPIPATLYVELHDGDPGAAGTANPSLQTDRQPVTRSAALSGTALSDVDVEWDNAPADETHTHGVLWDAPTGGNPWLVGAFTEPIIVELGGGVLIEATDLAITLPTWTG